MTSAHRRLRWDSQPLQPFYVFNCLPTPPVRFDIQLSQIKSDTLCSRKIPFFDPIFFVSIDYPSKRVVRLWVFWMMEKRIESLVWWGWILFCIQLWVPKTVSENEEQQINKQTQFKQFMNFLKKYWKFLHRLLWFGYQKTEYGVKIYQLSLPQKVNLRLPRRYANYR